MRLPILFDSIVAPFLCDDQGQDLIEYSLLLAFVVLGSAALFRASGAAVQGVWSNANTRLATTQVVAAS
jgi:Flp pilus assembly pilin Flp